MPTISAVSNGAISAVSNGAISAVSNGAISAVSNWGDRAMTQWLTLAAAGFVTYLTRASFLLIGRNITLPEAVQRSLRFVAPAAFAAIAVPGIVGDAGFRRLIDPDPRLIAAIIAGVLIWRTKSMPLALVAGMCSLWLLQAVWPA